MRQSICRILFISCFLMAVFAGCSNSGSGSSEKFCVPGQLASDLDCDGILASVDNCPEVANASQIDSDQDGIGDLCEPLACGDGVCDPQGGECDIFEYCNPDCTQGLCLGLPKGETCGDGLCQPLAGECSRAEPCQQDCPDPSFCFSPTCGDRECQPWEDDPNEIQTFCFIDCICKIDKAVEDTCHENADCLDTPGTVCGPDSLPILGPGEVFDVSQVACQCTLCGNTILDPGEGCDISAGFDGVEACFAQNGACDEITCECLVSEFDCSNSLDDDSDGMADCLDQDCVGIPPC